MRLASAHPHRRGARDSEDTLFDSGVDVVNAENLVDDIELDGLGGHAEDDRGGFVLRDDESAGFFDGFGALPVRTPPMDSAPAKAATDSMVTSMFGR
jgi:hypothetical protein